jgi:hypothetical protein
LGGLKNKLPCCGFLTLSFLSPTVLQYDFDEKLGLAAVSPTAASFCAPAFAAFMTGATYYGPSGARVAGLAGTIGMGAVGVTFVGYSLLGIPYGSQGFLFL